MKDANLITEEMIKSAYDYASMFEANKIDRLTIVKAYLAGRKKELTLAGNTPEIAVPVCAETATTYMVAEYDAEGKAKGVRITALGESFVVTLHDYENGKEVDWATACTLGAPTRKQAAIMSAVIDQLNKMLVELGGESLEGTWYWTSSQYTANSAWLYIGTYGSLDYNHKRNTYAVRPVLA